MTKSQNVKVTWTRKDDGVWDSTICRLRSNNRYIGKYFIDTSWCIQRPRRTVVAMSVGWWPECDGIAREFKTVREAKAWIVECYQQLLSQYPNAKGKFCLRSRVVRPLAVPSSLLCRRESVNWADTDVIIRQCI